jgi:hypothetical protein
MRLDRVTASQCETVPHASRQSYLRNTLVPRLRPCLGRDRCWPCRLRWAGGRRRTWVPGRRRKFVMLRRSEAVAGAAAGEPRGVHPLDSSQSPVSSRLGQRSNERLTRSSVCIRRASLSMSARSSVATGRPSSLNASAMCSSAKPNSPTSMNSVITTKALAEIRSSRRIKSPRRVPADLLEARSIHPIMMQAPRNSRARYATPP